LDLGAFPKGKKFNVDSLLDIWVYVRGMEWQDAFVVLLELASRNLLNLTSDPGSLAISFGCACELSFSQHDVMHDLALCLASRGSAIHGKRLLMPHKEDNIPTNWLTLKDQTSTAKFVSIHTGPMEEQDWPQIDFPEVEALALFFSASEYCLPTFLHTMPKLKVLIIYNNSSKRAILHGLPGFSSVTQLRSVLLQKLIVPPLYEYCRSWECLEKLSVCLCEGLGNMTLFDKAQALKFPKFVEINFDHCSDLKELPGNICSLTSLQRLSVTNCHLIQKLPDDLGRLRSLRLLRLSACPSLSTLPPSICRLQQLEFFDISLCMSLKDLPMEFGQLPKLKTLDMNECSGLKMLPKALAKLRSLKRVICDEHTEQQWLAIKASAMPNLTVNVVEERFNLDWLDD
jgi:Leucine-rich repeat (LRR) protein